MLAIFSRLVTEVGGRTLLVHPLTQIVHRIVVCVTDGFRSPGVHRPSGSSSSPVPRAWHVRAAAWCCTTFALAVLDRIAPTATTDSDTMASRSVTPARS